MSASYNTEPPTQGKVVLNTTLGSVDIELWAKEAPKAVRNFVQLCLEGYYDGTPFHRVVKGFLVQGGDPTGTGKGGESIYGHPFKDEFHSRIKFNHRGQVAYANENKPGTNGSQFFWTLERADALDRKNTIFGTITGESLYNAMHFGELEVEEATERPLEVPILLSTEVLWNPFEDIVPRSTRAEREAAAAAAREAAEAAERGGGAGNRKRLGLLSFGGDEEEADEDGGEPGPSGRGLENGAGPPRGQRRMLSAHDALQDERLARGDAVPDPEEGLESAAQRQRVLDRLQGALAKKRAAEEEALSASERAKLARLGDEPPPGEAADGARRRAGIAQRPAPAQKEDLVEDLPQGDDDPPGGSGGDDGADEDSDGSPKRTGQHAAWKQEQEDRRDRAGRALSAASNKLRQEDTELLTEWQRRQAEYRQRKKVTGRHQAAALDKLVKFKAGLRAGGGALRPLGAISEGGPGEGGKAEGEGVAKRPSKLAAESGYAGEVRTDAETIMAMPAAWRVDNYLEDEEDTSLAALRAHARTAPKMLEQQGGAGQDANELVTEDTAEEGRGPAGGRGRGQGRGGFDRAAAKAEKRNSEWARGRR